MNLNWHLWLVASTAVHAPFDAERLTRFKCQFCSYTAEYQSSMARHERRHTGERPFACTRCSQTFKQKSHLDKHVQKHVQAELQRLMLK